MNKDAVRKEIVNIVDTHNKLRTKTDRLVDVNKLLIDVKVRGVLYREAFIAHDKGLAELQRFFDEAYDLMADDEFAYRYESVVLKYIKQVEDFYKKQLPKAQVALLFGPQFY